MNLHFSILENDRVDSQDCYKWKKVQEAIRVVGVPTENDLVAVENLGHALAAGIDFGIFLD